MPDQNGSNGQDQRGQLMVPEADAAATAAEISSGLQTIPAARLGQALEKIGPIAMQDELDLLSQRFGVGAVDLNNFEIDPEVIALVTRQVAEKYKLIPLSLSGVTLVVAMSNPDNVIAIDDVRFHTGLTVEAVPALESAIDAAIQRWYDARDSKAVVKDLFGNSDDFEVVEEETAPDSAFLARAAEDEPVVKLVYTILDDAIRKAASDVHVEVYEKSCSIRFRLDGVLHEAFRPPPKLFAPIVSRIKVMANLKIEEHRLPQDGRIKLRTAKGKEIDFRVSVMPTICGEKVVLRLLDKDSLQVDMTKLGLEEVPLRLFKAAIHKPFGMVLVTGPTGSGKTTTLYSALVELNDRKSNISTAEDPVEYQLRGINQVGIREDIGLTFANALRTFLRQDPDVIMVGEIRDFETAEIAIRAALTGHMVLSTLHTNDAPSSITRLLNMGIEPFLINASVQLVAAQRLVRKICSHCKEELPVSHGVLKSVQVAEAQIDRLTVHHGAGCLQCNKTGYRGRLAVFEVMPMTDEIREFVINGAAPGEIKHEAVRLGMKTMRQAALTKVAEGVTTIEEVVRVTAED